MSRRGDAIREHNFHHHLKENHAIYITEILEEAAHLVDLKDDHRLIELPVAPGDTVYRIGLIPGNNFLSIQAYQPNVFEIVRWLVDGDWGLNVFTTYEEAEAAIAITDETDVQ